MSEEEKSPATGESRQRIAVIGNWHLAFVTAASLAQQGHDVVLVNHDVDKPWTTWTTEIPKLDIAEPYLDEIMRKSHVDGRLWWENLRVDGDNLSRSPWSPAFASKPSMTTQDAESPIIWLAIDTPLRDDGSPDVEPLIQAVRASLRGPCARCGRVTSGVACHQCGGPAVARASLVVVSSQVPVGFCEKLQEEVGIPVPVAYVPENLQLGKAMQGFREPDRLVIGATSEEVRQRVADILMFSAPTAEWVSDYVAAHASWKRRKRERILTCDLPTAEMIKHATNAFLATSISFANEMAKVGEAFGADNQLVAKALKMDSRIGPKAYVRPGLGFAGGTLARDLRALQEAGRDPRGSHCLNRSCRIGSSAASGTAALIDSRTFNPSGCECECSACREPQQKSGLDLVDAVLLTNDRVIDHIAKTIAAMEPNAVWLLGYTYKAETDTLRCSPARQLATALYPYMGDYVFGFDPRMNDKSRLELYTYVGIHEHHLKWGLWAAGSPRIVYAIITPLPEFKKLDWQGLGQSIVFDLCDGADKQAVLAAGLSYKAIWQPMERA